jgi:hypothetical protein
MDINNYLNNAIKFLPFIIVVCFVIYSIISADVKSIIFLSGLLITVFLTNIILPFNGKAIPRKGNQSIVATEPQKKGVYKDNKTNSVENTFQELANNAGELVETPSKIVAAVFAAISSSGQRGGKKTVGGKGGEECQLLFLDADDNGNGKPISQIPLCIVTMWYLFSYILTIIGTENIWGDNIPVIVILGFISIFYTGWFVNRSDCVDNFFTDGNKETFLIWFKPVIIGSLCGFLWALYISAINIAELKYFAGLTKDERCSRPKRALYKCEFKNPV